MSHFGLMLLKLPRGAGLKALEVKDVIAQIYHSITMLPKPIKN